MINIIILSKDRGCQIDLFLRSMKKHWKGSKTIPRVIYKATTPEYQQGYDKCRAEHSDVIWVPEGNLKATIQASMYESNPYTVFFCDDCVFVHDFESGCEHVRRMGVESEIMCLALRLRPGLNMCYAYNRPMKSPPFNRGVYEWRGAEGDYGYPMSLDGSIFRTDDIRAKINDVEFSNPNQLEGALAGIPIQKSKVLCFQYQVVVNCPFTRVQTENQNRFIGHDAQEFNSEYLLGKKLSLKPFTGRNFRSAHVEVVRTWE